MMTFDKLSRMELDDATEFLIHELPFVNAVDVVIQLGSGQHCQHLLDEEWDRVALRHMPHLPAEESLAKHSLEVVWGRTGTHKVLILAGRYHIYEGYGRVPCILPIWAAGACGARTFVLTNAAASLNPQFSPGNLMVFSDHLNNLGISALSGHQHLMRTPFVDMTAVYDAGLADSFIAACASAEFTTVRGVYMANIGPQYQTPSEIRLARQAGVDAVGMSTVLEATVARALGGKVMAVSMLADWAAGVPDGAVNGDVAVDTKRLGAQLVAALHRWLSTTDSIT